MRICDRKERECKEREEYNENTDVDFLYSVERERL